MIIRSAIFKESNTDHCKCSNKELPEFAFIGRSNVGKSSLINSLSQNKKLAKTSSTPGKTQLINHFLINNEWFLVDLPGYGYARSSKKNRSSWNHMVSDYLLRREQMVLVFVLVDPRIPPQKMDIEFINFLGEHRVPLALVYTKTDKQGKNTTAKNIAAVEKELRQTWDELPPSFLSSSLTGRGREELLQYIEEIISSL